MDTTFNIKIYTFLMIIIQCVYEQLWLAKFGLKGELSKFRMSIMREHVSIWMRKLLK